MVFTIHNLLTDKSNTVKLDDIDDFLGSEYKKDNSLIIITKERLNKVPKNVLVVNPGNHFYPINVVETVIVKKYARQLFGINKQQTTIDNIKKNLKKVNTAYNNNSDVDYAKVDTFLNELSTTNIDEIVENNPKLNTKVNELLKDTKVNTLTDDKYEQKGGIIIWIIEKFLASKAEDSQAFAIISLVFGTILDIIDVVLGIAGAIPGLQAVAGLGFILDFIGIALGILRFDVLSTIFDIISFLPVVGDILGGVGNTLKGVFKIGKNIIGFGGILRSIKEKHDEIQEEINDIKEMEEDDEDEEDEEDEDD